MTKATLMKGLVTALAGLGLSLAQAAPASAPLRIGLGYVPNVQFTPFYVADKLRYYQNEGLNVTFQHGYISELLPLLLQGKLDAIVGDPEDAIFAQNQGAPVRYVMAMYQQTPVTIFSLKNKNIRAASDLKGKRVGVPGPFGSTYFALQALLDSQKLTGQVQVANIGFTQLQALRAGQIDAAVGYINNDVVNLKAAGVAVNTLAVYAAYPMVGVGLITTTKVMGSDLGRKLVRASQRGIQFTLQDPARAYKLAQPVFGAGGGSLAVLKASLPLMHSALTNQYGLGYNDPAAWQKAVAYLQKSGKVEGGPASRFYSNALLTKTLK